MPFVNEYIPEDDLEKRDLRKICGDHNLRSRRGRMHSNHWTINRDIDSFMIQVWSHHESTYEGWALYWGGEWIFFQMRLSGYVKCYDGKPALTRYIVKGFCVPDALKFHANQVIDDFRSALSTYCGAGVFSKCNGCDVEIDFISGSQS